METVCACSRSGSNVGVLSGRRADSGKVSLTRVYNVRGKPDCLIRTADGIRLN